jgi:hypothetical protein
MNRQILVLENLTAGCCLVGALLFAAGGFFQRLVV